MKIHEIFAELYKLQYENGIKFREIRFENYSDISHIDITIKKDDKIMKHVFSLQQVSENPTCLGDADNDYLDFAFDRMVEEIKGDKNETYRRNE